MIIGPKPMRIELALGAEMIEKSPGPASRYFFVRAGRKLTRRFDRELYENEENRLSKALPLMRSILEALDACMPGASDDRTAFKEASKILPTCAKLEDLMPDATPIFQIRSMGFWARLAPHGTMKTIILEHADRMLDSARNALLKVLEEPPPHLLFILTTTRRQAILPTILSRVRPYRFIRRSGTQARTIVERVFRSPDNPADSLEAFFNKRQPDGLSSMTSAADSWIASILGMTVAKNGPYHDEPLVALSTKSKENPYTVLACICARTGNFGASDETMSWSFNAFLDAGGRVFSNVLKDNQAGMESLRIAEHFAALSRDAIMRHTSYNLNPVALVEGITTAMLEVTS
jgi:DNA polymerase-3 subunit gamma/tau